MTGADPAPVGTVIGRAIEDLFHAGNSLEHVIGVGADQGWTPDDVRAVLAAREWNLDGSGRLPRSKRNTAPPGLRYLAQWPSTPPPARPSHPRRPRSLTDELEELEAEDPYVAEAARSYDAAVDRLLTRSPATPPKEKTPAMPPTATPPRPPMTRAQEQTRELLRSVAAPTAGQPPPPAHSPVIPSNIRPATGGPYVAALSVVELFTDPTYQRPLDQPRVKRMVREWDPRMVGILDVSDRGPDVTPRYAIVNGQHRWSAAGRVGVQFVACNVHEGLAPADEASLMFELDRTTKKLSGWDKWRARRGAGDQVVATVERVAAGYGLRVDDAGELRSYGTAEKLLALGGGQLLDKALAVLHTAYGASFSAYQAPLLMGVGQLLHRHPDVDVDRLRRALAGTRPEQLRSTATALREVDGGPLHELMARAVAGQYNRLPGPRLAGRAA